MALFRGKDLDLPILTQLYQVVVPPQWEGNPSLLLGGELDNWVQFQVGSEPQPLVDPPPSEADSLPALGRGYKRDPAVVSEVVELRRLPPAQLWERVQITDYTQPGCLRLETLVYVAREWAMSGHADDAWRIIDVLTRRVTPTIQNRLARIYGISLEKVEDVYEEVVAGLYEAWLSDAASDEFWEVRFGACLDRKLTRVILKHRLEQMPAMASLDPESAAAVNAALDSLPEPLRTAFYMTEVAGFTEEVTGRHLAVSQSTVRNYLTRARALLEDRADTAILSGPSPSMSNSTTNDATEVLDLKALAEAHAVTHRMLDSAVVGLEWAVWSVRDLRWLDARHEDHLKVFHDDGLPYAVYDLDPEMRVPAMRVLNQYQTAPRQVLVRRIIDGLWSVVTGRCRVGRCAECRNPFIANERGPNQVFCSNRCGNRVRVRRHAAETNA
jgi:hypothetical protein